MVFALSKTRAKGHNNFLKALAAVGALCGQNAAATASALLTVRDAVEMVRIQPYTSVDGAVVAISPNGRRAAAVTWRGDVDRNVNVYSLVVFDVHSAASRGRPPETILSHDSVDDPNDPFATPFSQLTFLADNRTLAFLGRQGSLPAQLYTVDTATRRVRQLTKESTSVRSFVVAHDGTLRAFSRAIAPYSFERQSRIANDGVFLSDRTLFPIRMPYFSAMPALLSGDRHVRQYLSTTSGKPRVLFDSRQSRPAVSVDFGDRNGAFMPPLTLEDDIQLQGSATFVGNAQGTHALLFPYALTEHPMRAENYAYYDKLGPFLQRLAAPYGLIDLKDGRIERLIDAPHPPFGGDPLWVPDGQSVIVNTLLPNEPTSPPRWVEVGIAAHRLSPLPIPPEWSPQSWTQDGRTLLLRSGDRFATIRRQAEGRWGDFTEHGAVEGFNFHWPVASNGDVVIGVVTALKSPPELAAYDLKAKRAVTVSNFNPALQTRHHSEVERFYWQTKHEQNAFGFLVKPVAYKLGVRYPLAILLDDGTLPREGEPYLLDASPQLSGHPIQMLAAQGFMVLYPKEPHLEGLFETPEEGVRIQEHIEGAVDELDRRGLIDARRIGISGWSRAAYHVNYLLIHSKTQFAAASMIDGGAKDDNDHGRPFSDDELKKVRAPVLFEPHGPAMLALHSAMVDRMAAMGKQTEILYFATASHMMTQPQHRMRSLGAQLDWFSFWLQHQEDVDPSKRDQYVNWRQLREQAEAPLVGKAFAD